MHMKLTLLRAMPVLNSFHILFSSSSTQSLADSNCSIKKYLIYKNEGGKKRIVLKLRKILGHSQTTSAMAFWCLLLVSNWQLLYLLIFWIVVLRWMGENDQYIKVSVCSPQRKKFIITVSLGKSMHLSLIQSRPVNICWACAAPQHGFNAQMSSPGVTSGE